MISYDDAASLTAKTDLVRDLGLGGAMFWELSADDTAHTLVRAVHDELAR
jgi:GH18 family chitinase